MCRQTGFSLLELSLVLLVMALVSYSAIEPLGQWQADQLYRVTDARLQQAKRALIGYALTHARLPCPLPAGGAAAGAPQVGDIRAVVSPAGDGASNCSLTEGLLPAVTLAQSGPLAPSGALLDSWHRPIRYRVAEILTASPDTALLPRLLQRQASGDTLQICHRGQGRRCSGHALIASDVLFVVWSDGADPAGTGDQAANQDGDTRFAYGPVSSMADDGFDDQLTWISRSELVYWLVNERQ